ncbi:MAG: ATP-binding protein [Bacteroidales bacterium]|jgi:hypothetical protein|nr:ATP-binding protein [Bacteroidales bacterium]
MDRKLKRLPTGIQTFERIINENRLYVDKTQMLTELIDEGGQYFFARPRRFGKSLAVTTLEALLQGRKDLFKGLYAEKWFKERPDFKPCPVISLSMNKITTEQGLEALNSSLFSHLKEVARNLKVELEDGKSGGELFNSLINNLYNKHDSQIAILIDEYDKPYIDYIDDPVGANEVRNVLANLYVQVKANDKYLRFVFMTGISKFAKMGVFSKLNNLTDISLRDNYAALCGITKDELLANFDDYLHITAEEMQITKEELVDKMEFQYDGFSFNGKIRLYNPYSLLRFFEEKYLENFWFDGGTSTMMAKYIQTHTFTIEQFRGFPVMRDFVRNPGEMDSAPTEGFLFQCGFLTLREGTVKDFSLDYPNREVLDALSRLLSQKLLQNNYENLTNVLYYALDGKEVSGVIRSFNSLLASIPYDDYAQAVQQSIRLSSPIHEWLYRSSIFAFVRGCGLNVQAEMHTNKGRAGLVINYKGQVWIIELKVVYKGEDPAVKAQEAYNQIFEKNYDKPFRSPLCFGMAIDNEQRQITEYTPK